MNAAQSSSPDVAWLEAQYNNRQLVPDHGAYFDRWRSASAKARQTPHALLDLAYGHGQGETLDVFKAQGATNGLAPVMVFIHGGYWRSLDKSDHSFIAPSFTRQGVCVVVVNYALCPAVSIADIAIQMTKALAWVNRHISVHGGDPSRVTVAGHSAGGHLAAMLLACAWADVSSDLPETVVRNALGISGVYDLEPLRHVSFLQQDLRLTKASALKVSPACYPAPRVAEGTGVLATVVGGDESDEFRRQNSLMQQAWGRSVVPVCETIKGCNHFSILDDLARNGSKLHRLALELLGI